MKEQIISLLTNFYRRAPASIAQWTAGNIKRVIDVRDYGQVYHETRGQIKETQYATKKDMEDYQLIKLQEIVSFAWQFCSGYRRYWESNGFYPEALKTLADIKKIPFVTKGMIRQNLAGFSSSRLKTESKYITTSGSTGIPFGFYLNRREEASERAFMHDLWERRGFQRHYRAAVLRGAAVQGGYKGNPCAELSLFGELLLSAYHINIQKTKLYAGAIEDYNPDCIQAYPSALAQLTVLFKAQGIKVAVPRLKCIILASEKLYNRDKECIEDYWRIPIVHFYGMTEKTILAGPCEYSDLFHFYPQYGITEFIREDGADSSIGEQGELVGTSFLMRSTPFIRYRTGDIALKGQTFCPHCGRNYPLAAEIIGRDNEFILTAAGQRIPFSMAIGSIHNNLFAGLLQFQFIQKTPGELTLQYTAPQELSKRQSAEIEQELKTKIGNRFRLIFSRKNEILRTASGKYSFFKSELPKG